jgi:STE24 endopeptidase
MKCVWIVLSLFVCLAAFAQGTDSLANSQMPSVVTVPAAAQPSAHFDADAATEAYLAQIPPAARARSDAYFEGGYWLILWDFLYAVVVALVLLNLRWSARMRDLAERITKVRVVNTLIYWIEYLILTTVLTFPLSWYEGYFREHQYGMATQTFGPWLGDQLKGLLVDAILAGLVVALLFAVVRKLERTWWIWGAVVMSLFLIFVAIIGPIFILPLFNKVTPLNDPKVTTPVLRLAHMNGIQTNDVYQMDASKQTTRMSANVSGFGKTMRITMNDNLLRRGSPEEIQAVMGHEIGHYVLDHIYVGSFFFITLIVLGFALLRWALAASLARWGARWEIRGITDPAVLPLVVLLATIFFFVLTPIINTQTRTQEHEADMFGLNTSRQPDGFAQAAIHLGEYRKMSPGPIEEWIFFDHPSGRHRIHDAMVWKAQNLNQTLTPSAPPSPAAATTSTR